MTYATLEALGERSWAIFGIVLEAREGMDEEEWVALGARAMAATSLQAEALGRSYGSYAAPVDGQALLPPDVTTSARRPAPEDFEQRSGMAPAPDPQIDVEGRSAELQGQYAKALTTLMYAGDDFGPRAERLVTDETIASAQRGYQDGIRLTAQEAGAVVRDQTGRAYEEYGLDDAERPERDALQRQRPRTTSTKVRGYRRGVNPGCCELCFWLYKEGYVYPIDQPMHRHTGCRCVPVPTTDPVGRWALSPEEMQLLDDLYDRYVYKETDDDDDDDD